MKITLFPSLLLLLTSTALAAPLEKRSTDYPGANELASQVSRVLSRLLYSALTSLEPLCLPVSQLDHRSLQRFLFPSQLSKLHRRRYPSIWNGSTSLQRSRSKSSKSADRYSSSHSEDRNGR